MKRAIIIVLILVLIFFVVCITLSIAKNKEYEATISRVDTKLELYGKGVK